VFLVKNRVIQVLICTFVLSAACGEEKAVVAEEIPVTVIVVQPQVISETVNAPCRLEAGSEAVISVSVSGIVEEVLVSPGDTVQAGQRLLVLRTDDIQGAVVREAAAMLSAARASSEYARSNLQRATELVETGAMSPDEYGRIENEAAASEASCAQAVAGYNASSAAARNGFVLAPFDGVVGRVTATVGNPAAGPLIGIFSTGVIRAGLLVSPVHIGRLRPGLPAVFTTDHFPGQVFPGSVVSVSETADAVSGLVSISVQFTDTSFALVPGLCGMAMVSLETAENAIVLPGSSLTPVAEHSWEVALVLNGKAIIRPVASGIRNGNRYEILEGLMPGDSVINLGHSLVSAGTAVRVVQ
jgi:RND family efflux transporter MFP subunit